MQPVPNLPIDPFMTLIPSNSLSCATGKTDRLGSLEQVKMKPTESYVGVVRAGQVETGENMPRIPSFELSLTPQGAKASKPQLHTTRMTTNLDILGAVRTITKRRPASPPHGNEESAADDIEPEQHWSYVFDEKERKAPTTDFDKVAALVEPAVDLKSSISGRRISMNQIGRKLAAEMSTSNTMEAPSKRAIKARALALRAKAKQGFLSRMRTTGARKRKSEEVRTVRLGVLMPLAPGEDVLEG